MNQDIFNIICKVCGGKCCKCYYIFLTKKELKRLLKLGVKFKYKKFGTGWLMDSTEGCKFLHKQKGCKLNSCFKPFDCNFYPLAFIYKNKKLNFYLLKSCPYWQGINKSCLNEIKALARRRLKTWTEKEKILYSKLIKDYSKKELLKI